ncbi:MAG: glycosyltransferase family 39 protein [Saprospiraceae bacterium]
MQEKYKPLIVVTLVFVILSLYYEMPHWLVQRPCSVHVWRQTDCTSYALNYYQNDRGFFSPQVHHRHAIDGATSSEFPIMYYFVSKIYKIFGFHDYYLRWMNYVILFISLICLTLTSKYIIKNWLLSTFPTILIMMSCVIMYYGSNFLPDVPALCFAIIGFYFFVKHYFEKRDLDFLWSILFLTLAALLKISSAILVLSVAFYVVYSFIFNKNQKYTKIQFFTLTMGFVSILSWLIFVKIYNEIGQYYGNLQGTMGIWTVDRNEILYIIKRTFTEWVPALISKKIWLFFVPVMIYLLFYWKKIHPVFQFFLPVTLIACIIYLLSFFAVFNVHDYYFINVFCFPILLSIAFFHVIESQLNPKNLKNFMILSAVLFMMCAEDARAQFLYRKYDVQWNAIPHKGFYTIEKYLRSLNIDRNELVYSPSDPTTNVTLYLMNNPGWTRLFGVNLGDAVQRGARYMIIEESLLESEEFLAYKSKVIGNHEGLLVVELFK